MRFDNAQWTFGDIREIDGSVSHNFSLTNTSSSPIAIDRVTASCGCTTPEYPKTPISPGAKAQIKVTFNPHQLPGEFTKTISVISGGGKYRDFLSISGRVIPRPKTIEEEFPFDMGRGFRVANNLLTFRSVSQGRSAQMTVDYINTTDKTVKLDFKHEEGSGIVSVFAPDSIGAKGRGTIVFTYDLSERQLYGQIHDVTRPVIDGVQATKTIYSTMTGIDNFTGVDMDSAPRFFIDTSFHDFGRVPRRSMPHVFRMTASNEGATMLHIRGVEVPDGLMCTLREGMKIAPGEQLPFEIVLFTTRFATAASGDKEVRESIRLVVNDPLRPSREIRIAATIDN
jgi:hypothetical protein